MNSKKTLILFTSTFPFGKGEQFLETEIKYLSEAFEHVLIYPIQDYGSSPRPVSGNVKTINHSLYSSHKRHKTLFNNLFLFLKVWTVTLFYTRHKAKYVKKTVSHSKFLLDRINDSLWLEKEIKNQSSDEFVFYSYWCNYWAIILCLLKEKKAIKQFNVRVHGGDLDESRRESNYFPFREFLYYTKPNVYSISRYGINYITKNYNVLPNLFLSRLGVDSQGANPFKENSDVKTIVSCSFIYPLKRINLIVDFIEKLNIKVKWIHFGDGVDTESIQLYAKQQLGAKANVSYEFKGLMKNEDIMQYYKTNSVDLFINLSELEGIPVSIMEAISFGIPCIGCNVGGVGEIVTESTGFLLDKNFEMNSLVKWVEAYFNSNVKDRRDLRDSTLEFWKKNFDANTNYVDFISKI